MELSMSLGYLKKMRKNAALRTTEEAAQLCKNAGFCHVDYTPDCTGEDWERNACEDRKILDAMGIRVEQTHVPFNRYGTYDPEMFPLYCQRTFEASKILGAKYVVIHADEYRTKDHYDAKEIEDFAYGYLAPYVDYAAKHDLVVAVENVFEDVVARCPQIDGKSRFTSRIDELQGIIERFNSPTVA